MNTSQDPEYEGPTFYEKKIHKTHFESPGLREKMYDFSKDPDYVQIGPGRWRYAPKKQISHVRNAQAARVRGGDNA